MREYGLRIVRDGIYYACALALAGVAASNFLTPWAGVPFYVLGIFCLYFFRDPERVIPTGKGLIVSPGDGMVTEAVRLETTDGPRHRISIFLSVFDVHVNRSPIAGMIVVARYQKGKYLNAMNPAKRSRPSKLRHPVAIL